MTPDRLEEINRAAKGDPWVIGRELVKVIGEQEAEIKRLTDQVVEFEDAVPARITAELERDDLKTKLAAALQSVTALTQTIRAYPDAVGNSAANLAHARAERDRVSAENTRLHEKITAAQTAIGEHRRTLLPTVIEGRKHPADIGLDALRAVEDALAGPRAPAIDTNRGDR